MAQVKLSRATAGPEGAYVEELRARIEQQLAELQLPEEPIELYDAVRYALEGGGKRLRPVLLLLAAEAAGGRADDAIPAALAVEIFHTFTLVHDDIMDNAAERRGRPAVHIVWNESTAILSGDFLMGLSYELLARSRTHDLAGLVHRFHRMVAAVCEGQALDDAFACREDVSVQEYLDMISRKTGALLECTMELGAIIASADSATTRLLARTGRELGRAFQIQDDLLDLTADDPGWGKTIGGDLVEAKKTFLLLHALERAGDEDRAWFERIVREGGLATDLVPEARSRMSTLGVLQDAAAAVDMHSAAAVDALTELPDSDAREALVWLTQQMASRGR
jgi:geranylgeranyl diphosphate synthase, type II